MKNDYLLKLLLTFLVLYFFQSESLDFEVIAEIHMDFHRNLHAFQLLTDEANGFQATPSLLTLIHMDFFQGYA